jgi:hypothetical protein
MDIINCDDDEEDCRKPAAQPSPPTQQTLRTDPIETSSAVETFQPESDVLHTITGEVPFLITHWLAGFTDRTAVEAESEVVAAMSKIQKATEDLAIAFQTLGAYGKMMKVSIEFW